tara:strand:+ start:1748 stop:2677 length:930 start_codon:yes stop_codon:yes gene_type:complete
MKNNNTLDNQPAMSSYTELNFKPNARRNIYNKLLTTMALIFTCIAILPLILVISYILIKGISQLNLSLLTQLPEPPGTENAGGIGNAILGTFLVTGIAGFISVPIGVGGGIYLSEYSKNGSFSKFIRLGTNILAGIPSIIAGIFVYGVIVSTKILFGSNFSGLAGGIALSILMIPTIIKTTDEGLKLVSNELRTASLALGASNFTTITKVTLPSAFAPIATGIVLALARAAGETAPLIFTALFSFYWSDGFDNLFNPVATLSVLIYNFALEPYEAQNQLAWGASFILILMILFANLFSRWLSRYAIENK